MILVTVGTQLAFDRLVRAVEQWCKDNHYTDVVFQVGVGEYIPEVGKTFDYVDAADLDLLFARADVIVGHAGMGTILTALTNAKPVVVMPRDASRGEHRNDHQLATFRKFEGRSGIFAALDEGCVGQAIADALSSGRETAVDAYASVELIKFLKENL